MSTESTEYGWIRRTWDSFEPPEGWHAELLAGEIVMQAGPSALHSFIAGVGQHGVGEDPVAAGGGRVRQPGPAHAAEDVLDHGEPVRTPGGPAEPSALSAFRAVRLPRYRPGGSQTEQSWAKRTRRGSKSLSRSSHGR